MYLSLVKRFIERGSMNDAANFTFSADLHQVSVGLLRRKLRHKHKMIHFELSQKENVSSSSEKHVIRSAQ